MPVPASATSVGAGGRSPTAKSPSGGARSGSGGGTVKQRKAAGGGAAVAPRGRNSGAGSMWRFYTGENEVDVYFTVWSHQSKLEGFLSH